MISTILRSYSRIIIIFFLCCVAAQVSAEQLSNANSTSQNGSWVHSEKLKPGMKILTADHKTLIVAEQWQPKKYPVTTYNISVNNNHTYFVNAQKIWTHNITQCDELDPFSPKQPAANKNFKKKELNIKEFDDGNVHIGIYADNGNELVVAMNSDSHLSLITHADDIITLGVNNFKPVISIRTHPTNVNNLHKLKAINNAFKNDSRVKDIQITTTDNNIVAIDIIIQRGF